jgi:thimet oligopeptidase
MPSWRCVPIAVAGAWLAASAVAAPYTFPVFDSAARIDRACSVAMTRARAAERHLEVRPPDATLLGALDDLAQQLEDTMGPVGLLAAVHADAAVRGAASACERQQQAFVSAFLQNARIYRLLRRLEPVDDIDRRFRQDQLDAFEDAGVALSPSRRLRARQIARQLARRIQDFERRILEDKRTVAFTEAELDGVPRAVWAAAPRDGQGRYRLGLDAPTYQPVVEYATQSATRERMWRAGLTQGGEANLRTLDDIARLRREEAALQGFPSYADFTLRRRMAHDETTVTAFLASVQAAVGERELADLSQLQAAQPGVPLQRWDVPYQVERLRRARHGVDQEQFRPHFPPDASLDFVFHLAGRLFGVTFEPQPQRLWHRDAHAFAVHDGPGGAYLGTLFVDLYPRPGKYNHAAVWGLRNVSTRTGRTPAAALVVNFNRNGLNLDELETLLHEFGHALHDLLSATRYASQGGTNVQHDFVEAPSQMLEDWVYDPKVVALFQAVCATCPPVPDGLLARAFAAREFGKGVQFARQRLFASYDLALYGRHPAAPLALWREMESATPLGHVPGSMFPAGFAHIAGSYGAGYYGYLWSLVLAEDLRTAFAGDRLSAETGRRFRDTVLSQGGQADAGELLRGFLGRPPTNEAFFKALSRP